MTAAETLTWRDLEKYRADPTLVDTLKTTKILDMLHFKDAARGDTSGLAGMVKDTWKTLSKHHLKVANHYVKNLQAAFRVARLPCLESLVFTLTYGELPLGLELDLPERDLYENHLQFKDVSGFGVATRAVLAKAKKEGDFYGFLNYAPVIKLLSFTRPVEMGRVQPTSEHSNTVAKCRKSFREMRAVFAYSGSITREKDMGAAGMVHEAYCLHYASSIKVAATRLENAQKKMGGGVKKSNGRIPDMTAKEWNKCVTIMDKVVGRNSCDAIMAEVGAEAIKMCQEVLLVDPDTIGHTVDEALFMPGVREKEIRSIVKRLKGKFGAAEVRFQRDWTEFKLLDNKICIVSKT